MTSEETMEWEEQMRIQLSYIDVPKKYHAGVISSIRNLLSLQHTKDMEAFERMVNSMKYDWDKPIDEMPEEWYAHNCALQKVIDALRKEQRIKMKKV